MTHSHITSLADAVAAIGRLRVSANVAPQALAASFVDVLAARDPEQLAELGRLIRRRLKADE